MRNINTKTAISLTLIGLFFTAASAEADYAYPDVASQEKIDLCVAAIADQANYDEADYQRQLEAGQATD